MKNTLYKFHTCRIQCIRRFIQDNNIRIFHNGRCNSKALLHTERILPVLLFTCFFIQTDKRKQDCYICGSYKKRTADCTAHFIRTDLLTAGVLSNLRQVTEYAARHESRFVKLLIQQNEIGGKRKTAAATKQLEQAQTRIAEVNRIIKRLYEDNVSGKISDERFMELSADYEQEQRELKDRAAALQEELSKSQAATVNAEKFMGIVRKHLAFEELTPTLLREMIEKIVVHECSYDENGTRRQDIEIYYSFVGKIDLPEA